LTRPEINELRDLVREELQASDPKRLAIGDLLGIDTVLSKIGAAAPQLHATWARMQRCCERGNWQWRLNMAGNLRTKCEFGLPISASHHSHVIDTSVEGSERAQCLLDVWPDRDSEIPSCGHSECGPQSRQTRPVIMDRPPPTLIVPDLLNASLVPELDLSFFAWRSKGVQIIQTKYVLWGCILNKANHFMLGVNKGAREGKEDIVLYDGLQHSGRTRSLKLSLSEFILKNNWSIAQPIYIRIA
jgi:hypothetical protein